MGEGVEDFFSIEKMEDIMLYYTRGCFKSKFTVSKNQ